MRRPPLLLPKLLFARSARAQDAPAPPRPDEEPADEAVVRGRRPRRELTVTTVSRDEVRRIPGSFGDALRSIQNLPGVARAPFHLGVIDAGAFGARHRLFVGFDGLFGWRTFRSDVLPDRSGPGTPRVTNATDVTLAQPAAFAELLLSPVPSLRLRPGARRRLGHDGDGHRVAPRDAGVVGVVRRGAYTERRLGKATRHPRWHGSATATERPLCEVREFPRRRA